MRRTRAHLILIAAAIVVALHAALLWQRIADLTITDPLVIFRWIASAIAGIAAVALLRRRASWRAWVVFWLVILVLHAAAPPQRFEAVLETIFVLAPWLLFAICVTRTRSTDEASYLSAAPAIFAAAPFRAALSSRAPPR